MSIANIILILFVTAVLLPIVTFYVIKAGTTGFLRGRHLFYKRLNKGKHDGTREEG